MRTERWEHFPHDADVGIRGYGRTLSRAFEQAAVAMTAVITDPAHIRSQQSTKIECAAPDLETLFVDWLNRLVLEMATQNVIFARFEVEITGQRLTATAWGEPLSDDRHRPAAEVKGRLSRPYWLRRMKRVAGVPNVCSTSDTSSPAPNQ